MTGGDVLQPAEVLRVRQIGGGGDQGVLLEIVERIFQALLVEAHETKEESNIT